EGETGERGEEHDRDGDRAGDDDAVPQRLPERDGVEHPGRVLQEFAAWQQRRHLLGEYTAAVAGDQERPVERERRTEDERGEHPVGDEVRPADDRARPGPGGTPPGRGEFRGHLRTASPVEAIRRVTQKLIRANTMISRNSTQAMAE